MGPSCSLSALWDQLSVWLFAHLTREQFTSEISGVVRLRFLCTSKALQRVFPQLLALSGAVQKVPSRIRVGVPSTSELAAWQLLQKSRKKAWSTQLRKTLLIPAVNSLLAGASSNSHARRNSISSRVLIMPDIWCSNSAFDISYVVDVLFSISCSWSYFCN